MRFPPSIATLGWTAIATSLAAACGGAGTPADGAGAGADALDARNDGLSARPCPDSEGGLNGFASLPTLPACDATNQYQDCPVFEGHAICVDGLWLSCTSGAPPYLCSPDGAAAPEGSPCCPGYYKATWASPPSCCVGPVVVECTQYHLAYRGACSGLDAAPDAAGDATSDTGRE